MTVSNKQLSIIIILAFFAGILIYFFLWFGYVEIFINHVEVESFQVKYRSETKSNKSYFCDKNPCRIKVRAGQKFFAKIDNDLAAKKTIFINKIPLWKTEKIIIQAKKEIPEVQMEKISRQNLSPDLTPFFQKQSPDSEILQSVLISENSKFVIFSRDFDEELQIFIKNKTSEQLLTTIQDEFLPIFLEKNFSLTENGIVVPAKNRVYYYDFATQRKFKILEINSLRISDISVLADGKEVIFYNLKAKKWQKKQEGSDEIKDLGNQKFAGFWNGNLLEVRGNSIYLNEQEVWQIPAKISTSNKIYLHKNSLIIEQDFEVWEIFL